MFAATEASLRRSAFWLTSAQFDSLEQTMIGGPKPISAAALPPQRVRAHFGGISGMNIAVLPYHSGCKSCRHDMQQSQIAKLAELNASYAIPRGQHKAAAATDYDVSDFHSKMRQQKNTTETQHFFRDETAAKVIESKDGEGRYDIAIEHLTMRNETRPMWPQWRTYRRVFNLKIHRACNWTSPFPKVV